MRVTDKIAKGLLLLGMLLVVHLVTKAITKCEPERVYIVR